MRLSPYQRRTQPVADLVDGTAMFDSVSSVLSPGLEDKLFDTFLGAAAEAPLVYFSHVVDVSLTVRTKTPDVYSRQPAW